MQSSILNKIKNQSFIISLIIIFALSLLLGSTNTAQAASVNLLKNGSFEDNITNYWSSWQSTESRAPTWFFSWTQARA